MPLNLPNLLTWLRILMIPLLVAVFYAPHDWLADHNKNLAATIIFSFAAITDWLDGYLARALNQGSAFGAFLDPVADKLLVAAALVLIVSAAREPRWAVIVTTLAAIVIIGREIAISALREWMAEIGKRGKVAVSGVGKFKTIVQIVGLSMMLFRWNFLGLPIYECGLFLTVLAAILTLWSAIQYLRAARPELVANS